MPDFGSATFSQTDSSNASGTMPSWSGAAAPSTLDDAGRALQGAVTREWNWRSYTLTAGGTSDAKTLTFSVAPAAYYNGQRFAFIANTTNTTTATLNVNSLGAKTIKKDVSGTLTNLTASEMVSGMFIEVAYNTANDCFVWVNRGIDAFPAGSASAPSITTTGDLNTGFWFPAADTIAASTGGSERLRVDSSGNVGIGVTPTCRFHVSSSGNTLHKIACAASNSSGIELASDTYTFLNVTSGAPFAFQVAGSEVARLSTTGAFTLSGSGGLGYGTGSGGSVTQLTSKSTIVTLNKTNGAITMNAASLAAGASVNFGMNNSTIASTDVLYAVHNSTGGGTPTGYSVQVLNIANGGANFRVTNVTGGALAEAVVINFVVIKAATS